MGLTALAILQKGFTRTHKPRWDLFGFLGKCRPGEAELCTEADRDLDKNTGMVHFAFELR